MLIISGFDGTSSAGILLDSSIATLFQIEHFCVLSALNMQNHSHYFGTQELDLTKQLECIDFVPSIIKIGLLYNYENIEILAKLLQKFANVKIICDTPIISSSGKILVQDVDKYIKVFKEALLPKIYLLTPNLEELQHFGTVDEIFKTGCKNVLVKGGHANDKRAIDVLHSSNSVMEFGLPRIDTNGKSVRGTGCGLATAIACYLKNGENLPNAIQKAKKFIHYGIVNSQNANDKTKILNFNGFKN